MSAIKRRQKTSADGSAGGGIYGCDLSERWPTVFQFLTAATYEDGSTRRPSSLTIFNGEDGTLKACLSDKDSEEVAFSSGGSLADLLDRLEDRASADELDWRSSKRGKQRK